MHSLLVVWELGRNGLAVRECTIKCIKGVEAVFWQADLLVGHLKARCFRVGWYEGHSCHRKTAVHSKLEMDVGGERAAAALQEKRL